MPFLTIPIALAIGGAASAGAGVYAAHRAGSTNDKALAAEERDSVRQQGLQREAMAADKARWDDYVRVHEPIWGTAGNTLHSLQQLAGMSGENAPSMQTPAYAPQTGGTPPPGGGGTAVPRGPTATGSVPSGAGRRIFDATRVPTAGQPRMSLMDLLNMAQMATAAGSGGKGGNWTGPGMPGLASLAELA